MSWIERYPRLKSKNDLRGVPLRVLSDKPPEPAAKKGIFELQVMNTENSEMYKVLCTSQDIQNVIDITCENKPFTFDQSEPYAKVIPYVKVIPP